MAYAAGETAKWVSPDGVSGAQWTADSGAIHCQVLAYKPDGLHRTLIDPMSPAVTTGSPLIFVFSGPGTPGQIQRMAGVTIPGSAKTPQLHSTQQAQNSSVSAAKHSVYAPSRHCQLRRAHGIEQVLTVCCLYFRWFVSCCLQMLGTGRAQRREIDNAEILVAPVMGKADASPNGGIVLVFIGRRGVQHDESNSTFTRMRDCPVQTVPIMSAR